MIPPSGMCCTTYNGTSMMSPKFHNVHSIVHTIFINEIRIVSYGYDIIIV